MTKKIIVLLYVLAVSITLASCASTSGSTVTTAPSRPKTEVIDHQGMAYGIAPPEWFEYAVQGLASKIASLYPGQQPIVYSATGSNKDLLKRRGNTTGVNAEVARIASTAVIQNANDMAKATGQEYDVESYSDAVQQAAMSAFQGLKKEGEWWTLVRDSNGKEEYRYFFLYLMDNDLFSEQISTLSKDTAKELNNTSLEDAVERNADDAEKLYDRIQNNENKI